MITDEMRESFFARHNAHVERVNKYLEKIIIIFPEFADELRSLGSMHDHTKLMEENIESYMRFNWMVRTRGTEKEFKLTEEEDAKLKQVRKKHGETELHHPAAWENVHDMDKFHLCELCADWCAINEELKQSPFTFADKVIGNSIKFNEFQEKFVRKLLTEIWDKNY